MKIAWKLSAVLVGALVSTSLVAAPAFSDQFIPSRPHCGLAAFIAIVVAGIAREHALDAVGA